MKINKIITLLLLFFTTVIQSKIAYSPEAIHIKEINGKLYQMTREQWYQEPTSLDESNELKPQQWAKIIKQGNPELATALLHALDQYLPNDELERYLTLGLLRKQNGHQYNQYFVAQKAYMIWKNTLGWESAYQIRIDKKLRQNLQPDVNWKSLFIYASDKFATAADAVNFLHNQQEQIDIGENRYHVYQAINTIYQHQDIDDLKLWMQDSEFSVALGSWLALHRLAPEKHAKEILKNAIWWQAELEYSYGSGCVRMSAKLTPLIAALDLFSDYLSTDQIHKALLDVPELWQTNGIANLAVTNPQTFNALQRFADKSKIFYEFDRIQTNKQLQAMNNKELADFLSERKNLYEVRQFQFNQNLLDYLTEQLKQNPEFKDEFFVYQAFENKNDYAKQFVQLFIETRLDKANSTERDRLRDVLFRYVSIWPRDWQALKQQAMAKLD